MSDKNPIPHTDPQRAYLAQLQSEGSRLPESERAEHEALVSELAGELALSESMQLQAGDYIARAKLLVMGGDIVPPKTKQISIDAGKIGWLAGTGEQEVSAQEILTPELDYLFVDLTGKHRVTQRLRYELTKQGVDKKLTEKVTTEGIPALWNGIVSGRDRSESISIGSRAQKHVKADRSLNTSFPAYKIDAQGTNNRAIVMLMGRAADDKPIISLAALYDHKDQADIYKSLFLKTLHQKHQ